MTKHARERHGQHGTRTYSCWVHMWQRCTNPKVDSYKSHGARGITVCKRWRLFTAFFADMGEQPNGLTLERNNNNGNYTPENCRWATQAEQNQNNSRTKLTSDAVRTIRLMRAAGMSFSQIGIHFSASKSSLKHAANLRTWRNVQ